MYWASDHRQFFFCLACILAWHIDEFRTITRADDSRIDFNRQVRPILSQHCYACHGFDEKARQADLRLDRAESATEKRESGQAIVPGQIHSSLLWQRINSDDPDTIMPPPKAHAPLSPEDRQILGQWIEQGADYAGHWSFIPPRRIELPSNYSHLGTIDGWVQKRLDKEGLAFSPQADPSQLIRRVSLDLTGLPPSTEEVLWFLEDPSEARYEEFVDRCLKNPHYGERMALEWLDAARYADTNGFSIDGGRNMWLWRDWVIQSFRDHQPYDRFIIDQIAGDLLPDATMAQKVATGFQRNNMVTHEGGTIAEENIVNYNADRVKTLGESILGLTLGCAQCHDHKFDPISQKDYYQLFAFYQSLGDLGHDGNSGINPSPSIPATTVLVTQELDSFRQRVESLQQLLNQSNPSILNAWEERERAKLEKRKLGLKSFPMKVLKVSTPNRGAGFEAEGEHRVRLDPTGGLAAFDVLMELPADIQTIDGIRLIVYPDDKMPGGGWGNGGSEHIRTDATIKKGTFVLTAIGATISETPGDQVNMHQLEPIGRVTASTWEVKYPPANCLDTRNENGWSPSLEASGPQRLTATFAQPVPTQGKHFITAQVNFGHGNNLIPTLFEIQAFTGVDDDTDLPDDIVSALTLPAEQRTAEQMDSLWRYCAQNAEELSSVRVSLANHQERIRTLTEPFPTMIMATSDRPRATHVLFRGDYAQPRDQVEPGTPSALPGWPESMPRNRLGLAQWLTMPDHPLTSRVAVNRFWQMLFGSGIVATPADFGAQGEWPSHPELLDSLAVEFVESGWNVQSLIKRIVMSRTYRQSSHTSVGLLQRDPANRLLARGPRFRLSGEMIRDQALRISGLMVPWVGGPSVNPYQPADLWREVSHYGSTPATAQTFVQDHGEKLYRRSLYTYWKRTVPPPNMATFDAPNRETCTVRRASTTTPLQALVTLNDVQFVEANRAFAEKLLLETSLVERLGGGDSGRIRFAFLECLSRYPKEGELSVLMKSLKESRSNHRQAPEDAQRWLAVGESRREDSIDPVEHAAWMEVASILLNLSETLTRN